MHAQLVCTPTYLHALLSIRALRAGRHAPEPRAAQPAGLSARRAQHHLAGGCYLEGVYFLDCIARGQAPQIVSPHSAMDTVRLVRAEIESARQGGCLVRFE